MQDLTQHTRTAVCPPVCVTTFFSSFCEVYMSEWRRAWVIATSCQHLHALPLPSKSLAIHGEPRYCKKIKHSPKCAGTPCPSYAVCMLQAARTNIVSVVLKDNYIQFRILSLGQHRAALKNTVNSRTNTERSSFSLTHTHIAHTHTLTQIHPCNWLPLTLPPLSPRLTLCLAISAVCRPNGTIICNFCSNLTDHLPSKWNSALWKKREKKTMSRR